MKVKTLYKNLNTGKIGTREEIFPFAAPHDIIIVYEQEYDETEEPKVLLDKRNRKRR